MRFLTDTEIAEIVHERERRVAHVVKTSKGADWRKLSLSDLLLLRAESQAIVAEADKGIAKHVNHLRGIGAGWAEIGKVLGISKQAAQQRFGD
jgi:hypothetical protein